MATPTQDIAASAARTATGNSGAIPLPESAEMVALLVNVSAVSGTTPSMALTVEWSNDGTNWAQGDTADSLTAITTAIARVKQFSVKGRLMRVVWTITGTTPSFTFSATGTFTGPRNPA